MTIQNQEMEEAKKSSFDVDAEVADPTGVSAKSPGAQAAAGDGPESIMQGSSGPKTKVAMIAAVMANLSKMKKEDVEQQLAKMNENGKDDEDELEEAKDPIKDHVKKAMKEKYGPGKVTFTKVKGLHSANHENSDDGMSYSHEYHPVTGKISKTPHFTSSYYEQAELDKRGKKVDEKHMKKAAKITKEDINVSEDIAAAFSGSDLSEEFKTKATEIFQTAVVSAVNMKLAEIAEQAEGDHEEEMNSINKELTSKIDQYLDYVVEEWMKENKLAVESGLRSEVTENFLTGLRDLFAEHYVDIPEEKVQVVEELADEVEQLTATVNEEMQKNIELKKQIEKFEREIAFVEVSEGLTEIQIAKFESLAEAVDYDNAESYKEKLETIRKSFFERNEEVKEKKTTLDEEFIDTNETESKVIDPSMQSYSAAISRSVKK